VSSYLPAADSASQAVVSPVLAAPVPMVAFRAADLQVRRNSVASRAGAALAGAPGGVAAGRW
jgi:hypothetical protein